MNGDAVSGPPANLEELPTLDDAEMREPDGPLWYTFAFTLPFGLGVPDEGRWTTFSPGKWEDEAAAADFGPNPVVRLRFRNQPDPVQDIAPRCADEAVAFLYGDDARAAFKGVPPLKHPDAYEQWVSLETPGARIEGENPDDKAYAFHRCLRALNVFLMGHVLAFGRWDVHRVSTHEIGALMFHGAYTTDGRWHFLAPMMMHPDAWRGHPKPQAGEEQKTLLAGAIRWVVLGYPFIEARLWYNRARSALQKRGDGVDCVVSLQTSMENMLYTTWRMLLVDEGKTASEIERSLGVDRPYKSLLVKVLPGFLGGRWDVTASKTPVGIYWRELYELRNRIVHTGFSPHSTEAEPAMDAYKGMRQYLNERLWAKRKKYPRAMLARIGRPDLFGWHDKWVDKLTESFEAEPLPWWWPHDQANRPASKT